MFNATNTKDSDILLANVELYVNFQAHLIKYF